jgi:hypothetical protein
MNVMYRLKSGWTTLKFIRVALGILILYSSIDTGQISGIVLGGIFTLISLLTDGVCCAGQCYMPVKKTGTATDKSIEYEELDTP